MTQLSGPPKSAQECALELVNDLRVKTNGSAFDSNFGLLCHALLLGFLVVADAIREFRDSYDHWNKEV